MQGELFEITDNCLRVVALDGFRIAIKKEQLQGDFPNVKVVIPSKVLLEVGRIMSSDKADSVNIIFGQHYIQFVLAQTKIIARLIEGNFFNIEQILDASKHCPTRIRIDRQILCDESDRALSVSAMEKKPIVFTITDRELMVQVKSSVGSMVGHVEIEKSGDNQIVGFNPKFLLDALKVIEDEKVELYFVSPKAPCFIKDADENYIYVILPVNV